MIHRMIDWERDPVAGYGDIVCGVIRTPDTECSIFASGYDCPACRRLTPLRQRVAQVGSVLADVRQHGPRGGKAERYLQMAYDCLLEDCHAERAKVFPSN